MNDTTNIEEKSRDEETPKLESDTEKPAEMGSGQVLAVGVQHRIAGDIYTFTTDNEEIKTGDPVVVEGEQGESIAFVAVPPRPTLSSELPKNIKKILRVASEEDLTENAKRKEEAGDFFELCEKKIEEHKLPMKLVDAELVESGKKIVFFFFAEQRVDFRALVKDLASSVHKYIEMRQIGSRDASSFVGCMGPCGRTTCCSSFLRNFQSISIAMAKNQGLSPNPAKLTGMCGKLKCCLYYENKAYSQLRKGLPKHGNWVETPKGVGKITSLDILRRKCSVRLEEGGETKFGCDECQKIDKQQYDKSKAEKEADKTEKQRSEPKKKSHREKK